MDVGGLICGCPWRQGGYRESENPKVVHTTSHMHTSPDFSVDAFLGIAGSVPQVHYVYVLHDDSTQRRRVQHTHHAYSE